MRSHWSRVSPHALIKGENADAEASAKREHHAEVEAETGRRFYRPGHGKACQQAPEARRDEWNRFSLTVLRGANSADSNFGQLAQSCGTIHFCCLSPQFVILCYGSHRKPRHQLSGVSLLWGSIHLRPPSPMWWHGSVFLRCKGKGEHLSSEASHSAPHIPLRSHPRSSHRWWRWASVVPAYKCVCVCMCMRRRVCARIGISYMHAYFPLRLANYNRNLYKYPITSHKDFSNFPYVPTVCKGSISLYLLFTLNVFSISQPFLHVVLTGISWIFARFTCYWPCVYLISWLPSLGVLAFFFFCAFIYYPSIMS